MVDSIVKTMMPQPHSRDSKAMHTLTTFSFIISIFQQIKPICQVSALTIINLKAELFAVVEGKAL